MAGYNIADALAHHQSAVVPDPSSRPSNRRRTWLWVLGAAILVAAAAGAGYMMWSAANTDDIFANPDEVELPPPPEDSTATAAYMDTPAGQKIYALLGVSAQLYAERSALTCDQALGSLETLGAPDILFGAGAAIPDQATAEMAVSHLDALRRYLGECLTQGSETDTDELHFTAVVLQRRLEELR